MRARRTRIAMQPEETIAQHAWSVTAAAAARLTGATLGAFTSTATMGIESNITDVAIVRHRALRVNATLIRLDDHTAVGRRDCEE
jgi:hypothetical protein